MGIIDIDTEGILNGGSKLVDSISNLFNADENSKIKIAELVNQTHEKNIQAAVNSVNNATQRLQADNQSDEKSTKTIRPQLAKTWSVVLILLICVILFGTFIYPFTEQETKVIEMLLWLAGSIYFSIISFYFTSKGFENIGKIKTIFNLSQSMPTRPPKSTGKPNVDLCIVCDKNKPEPNQFICKKCKGE